MATTLMLYSVVSDLQNPLLTGVGQTIATRDDTFQFLDTLSIGDSIQHKYNRELSLGATPAAFVAPGTAVYASPATSYPVTDNILEAIAAVQVPKVFNDPTQVAYQIGSKVKDIRRTFGNSFINGQAGSDIAGLKWITTTAPTTQTGSSGQVVSASGSSWAALTLGMLDALVRKVSVLNMPTFLVANRVVIDQYRNLLRVSAGGLAGNQIQLKTLGGEDRTYLTVQGVPMIASDWISLSESGTGVDMANGSGSSVYAVYSNSIDGLHLFYSTNPGSPIVNVDGPKPIAGVNAVGYDVTFNVGMSCKSTFAVARLQGVQVAF